MRKQPPTDLAKRLVWLSAFRVVAVTALVALGTVVSLRGSESEAPRAIAALSALAVAVNILQLGVAILLRLRRGLLSTLAAAQLAGDLVFATFLVLFTGLEDSLFGFVFPLAVVSGGILLGVAGAWSAAATSMALWTGMLLLRQQGWLGPLGDLQPFALGWAGVGKLLFAQGSASVLSAALVSYVTRQEQRAGKRAEEAESTLEELNVLHDAIVRSLASGIATTDAEGRITLLNRAGEEILGLPADELLGRPLETIFPSLGEALEGENQARRLEAVWRTREGKVRILGFTLTPLVAPDGERMGITAVFQNLTEFKELEQRAARSERLAAVGEIAAGLAHELRNPLGAISGSIEMLAEGRDGADERLLTIVMREIERLDALVASFLDFARPPPPNLETVELSRLIEETCELLATDPQSGAWERNLAKATIRADGAQLKQVIWNLMRNAAEASSGPEGHEGLAISCGALPERGEVFLCVSDRGCGMDESTRQRIFDPFFTTKQGGTGLGLATVHRIVDGMGGRLEVESELGQGTEVRLFLPVAEA